MANILIIDDEKDICDFIKMSLDLKKHNVSIAFDGVQALLFLNAKTHYDLIITDIVMPKKDGFELIFELNEFKMKIPIVVIHGGRCDFDVISPNELGIKYILKKPFTEIELYHVVDNAL